MYRNCSSLVQHILEHEIIGFETTATVSNITICDEGIFIASGVSKLDFRGTGIEAINQGSGEVRIAVPDIQVDGDTLWMYDTIRNKWLSVGRNNFHAGERGRAKNKYLLVVDGQTTNLSGWRMPRDATITRISAQTRVPEYWTLRIRKNGSLTNVASLALVTTDGAHNNTANIDVAEGDKLQFFADTTSFFGIKDPLVWIEIAWRNDILATP